MRVALVLGAGSSLAQAQSLRPVQRKRHPPLDANFFNCMLELSEVWAKRRALRRAVKATSLIANPWADTARTPPLEQFYADVYYLTATNQVDVASLRALLALYTAGIAETTNWIAERKSRIGDLGRLLRAELSAPGLEHLDILTFNHDLLIEDAIHRLPKRFGQLGLLDAYGLGSGADGASFTRMPPTDRFDHEVTSPVPISVHKLHGSLNWFSRTRDQEPRGRSFLLGVTQGSQAKKYFVHDSRMALLEATMTGSTRGWYIWPLVVPPTYDKSRMTGGSVLSTVWDSATTALTECDKLVICGYSLPAADAVARQLLRTAFAQNPGLRSVHVVNPDPGIVSRLDESLGADGLSWFRSIGDYLELTS